jgi:hypothetical protein
MGRLTIVVEHGWKVENCTKQVNGIPNAYQINQNARLVRSKSFDLVTPLKERPLASYVRITVPSSVAQLVTYYNTCTSDADKEETYQTCYDLLIRIERIIRCSSIPDTTRRNCMKIEKQSNSFKKIKNVGIPRAPEEQLNEKSPKCASEARISLLMLARMKSTEVRDQAMLLLVEALECNYLSSTNHEIMHLQMLWVELVQIFRQTLNSQVRNLSPEQGNSLAFLIDDHLEKVLTVLTFSILVFAPYTSKTRKCPRIHTAFSTDDSVIPMHIRRSTTLVNP